MSPFVDPKRSPDRWKAILDQERAESVLAGRMEYYKPLALLIICGGIVTGHLAYAGGDANASGLTLAALYPVILGVKLLVGVIGLWIACSLWLGGVGTLGLAILRLAGIYATADLVTLIAEPLMLLSWLIRVTVYVCLIAWLFDLDVRESIIVAIITWLLKVVTGAILVMAFAG